MQPLLVIRAHLRKDMWTSCAASVMCGVLLLGNTTLPELQLLQSHCDKQCKCSPSTSSPFRLFPGMLLPLAYGAHLKTLEVVTENKGCCSIQLLASLPSHIDFQRPLQAARTLDLCITNGKSSPPIYKKDAAVQQLGVDQFYLQRPPGTVGTDTRWRAPRGTLHKVDRTVVTTRWRAVAPVGAGKRWQDRTCSSHSHWL